MIRRRLGRAAMWATLAALSLTILYPLTFLVFSMLKSTNEYALDPMGPPKIASLEWLSLAWNSGGVPRYFGSSVIVVVGGIAVALLVSVPAAFALSAMRFAFRSLAFVAVIAIMLLPVSVQMIPIFLTIRDLGLLNNYLGLIILFAALVAPFDTYLLASYLRGIPGEIYQAAQCDGASPVRLMLSIAVPLAKPAISTLVVLNFLGLWNELLFSLLILQREENRTVMVGLATIKGLYPPVPLLSTIAFLSLVPTVAVFLLFQRSLSRGLTAAAVR